MKKVRIDLTGRVFGKIEVIKYSHNNRHKCAVWLCKCECGIKKTIAARDLISGKTISCGCHGKSIIGKKNLRHGQCFRGKITQEYRCYRNMMGRCYTPENNHYHSYGGRGIKVCDRWLGEDGFINFFNDMGKKPSKDHSLDRFPNNETGHYEPGNCRWGTDEQQARNKRTNFWIEFRGEKMIVSDFKKKIGVTSNWVPNMLRVKTAEQVYQYYKDKNISNAKLG